MKKHATIMGMPVRIHIVDKNAKEEDISHVFAYLRHIDSVFSTYKDNSEVSYINKGIISPKEYSTEMKYMLSLAEKTHRDTNGYFTITINNKLDPSGIVKGYAIYKAAEMLKENGYKNFCVDIAGDMQIVGNVKKRKWKIGIKNPFNTKEIVKVVALSDNGIATSGTYERGDHIVNPHTGKAASSIASITIIGPNAYEADRLATAAFAMGEKGILFIESLKDVEGYMITKDRKAYYTTGFEKFVV